MSDEQVDRVCKLLVDIRDWLSYIAVWSFLILIAGCNGCFHK